MKQIESAVCGSKTRNGMEQDGMNDKQKLMLTSILFHSVPFHSVPLQALLLPMVSHQSLKPNFVGLRPNNLLRLFFKTNHYQGGTKTVT